MIAIVSADEISGSTEKCTKPTFPSAEFPSITGIPQSHPSAHALRTTKPAARSSPAYSAQKLGAQ